MDNRGRTEGLDSVANPRVLLEELFEHSPIAFQVYGVDGRCLLVNSAFRRLFGSAPPPGYNVFLDDNPAQKGFSDHLQRALAGQTVTVAAHEYDAGGQRQVQGRRLGIEVTLFPLRDAGGSVAHVALCFKEVPSEREHEQAIKALVRSEARFHRLAEGGVIGVVIADIHGDILEANDAFLKTVGYTREQILSREIRWADMTPAQWKDHDQRALEELQATGIATAREKEYLRKDGSRVPVLVGGAMLEGTTDECIAFILDLTDRKRAEEALQRSEKRFRRLAESGIIGIVVSDIAGNIKEANDAFLSIVGYSQEDLRAGRVSGKTLNAPERERTDAHAVVDLRTHGVAPPWETALVRKDGSRVPVLNGVVLLEGATDERVAFVLDLTNRKRA